MTVRSAPTLCHSSFVVATKAIVLTFLFTLAFGAADAGSDPRLVDGAADIVLLGGKVITVAQNNFIAQAAALNHDRIVAVGDDTAIRKLIGPKTHVIQLHGNQKLTLRASWRKRNGLVSGISNMAARFSIFKPGFDSR